MKWLPPLTIIGVYILDQLSKLLIVKSFELNESIEIIGDYVKITYIENKGIAFGLFSQWHESWKILIFTSFTVIAIALVIYFYKIFKKDQIFAKTSCAMILGGALGNFTDKVFGYIVFHQEFKLFYGKVVDFIDVWIGLSFIGLWDRWPIFNVADIAITVGFILIATVLLKSKNSNFFTVTESGK